MAEVRQFNPWAWQNTDGFSWAVEVANVRRTIYCAGQVPVDGNGTPLHPGDMAAQMHAALDNLLEVLGAAGLTLAHVVRLNYFTTDMQAFTASAPKFLARLEAAGCRPASTLVTVAGLFHPDVLVELEATAVE